MTKLLLISGLLFGWSACMAAQQPAPMLSPTLDQVLTGVHGNFLTYLATVPNLFADEHVAASAHGNLMQTRGGTTDSIFRMRRQTTKDNKIELIESREAKGKQPGAAGSEQKLDEPSIATGLFSYGALDWSPDLKRCYDYRLEEKPQQLRNTAVVVVDYALRKQIEANANCPVREPVSGQAFVNPATMQIMRVEQKRPRHEVYPKLIGEWNWTVDYGLVDLDGKPFWLPQKISSLSIIPRGEWSFAATYTNYHLLTVHSTILPDVDYHPSAPGR